MSWTDERVELLKRLWIEGQSASQIAKELGGVTRNAVIGKVHRLGLSNRTGTEGDIAASVEETVHAVAEPIEPDVAPEPAPEPELPEAPIPAPVIQIAEVRAERAAARVQVEEIAEDEEDEPAAYTPRAIIPASQPLPPQPSTDEIDPEALAKVHEIEKTSRRLTLMELTERTCKWPIGDPATPDFWFCGLPTKSGKPYCDAHVAVAFQPMSSRRDRRR
ncbi:MAG: GcrA family cell cycle regulator [Roseinatronobacter sp.]